MTAILCTNRGCNKTFHENQNNETACEYHKGHPVFHEGLKGWSCCGKKVTDFDDFLKIPGCCVGRHEHVEQPVQEKPQTIQQPTQVKDKVEVYGKEQKVEADKPVTTKEEKPKVDERELNDPEDANIPIGTSCKRPSCLSKFESVESKSETCVFHRGEPVFHEGSKGWSCCARKVLEFDEFLKIKGCCEGKHRFLEVAKAVTVELRHDWYQTQDRVILSIFAKNCDSSKTVVKFNEQQINAKIVFKNGVEQEFTKQLFQPIIPGNCTFKVLSTKLELSLAKSNGFSWPSLDPVDKVTSWTTFGTSGKVGTIGSKEAVIASDAPVHLL